MKLLGLISLLITIALIAWLFSTFYSSSNQSNPEESGSYDQALDSAEEAVKLMEQ